MFYRFWEKGWTRWLFKKRKSAIFDDRKWILKKWKKRLGVFSFSIISENFKKIHRSISEKSAKQKKEKKKRIIIITRNSLRVMRRSSVTLHFHLTTFWWNISEIVCRHKTNSPKDSLYKLDIWLWKMKVFLK